MANTYVDYTATAAQQYFAFNFPYLEDEHVIVEIEGVDQTIATNYTIETSPTQRINLSNPTTALAGGELVRIKRRSAPNTNLVDFQNGSVLTESELDRAYLHNRYLAEEATEGADSGLKELEGSTNYNAGNKQIKNLADGTLATDAVNKGYIDTQIALSDTNLAGFYKSTHTGNAVDNVFTLSFTPQTTDAKAYIVSIDGLVQVPDTDYTIGATAITFNTIPSNSAEICVVATAAASVATADEAQVTALGTSDTRSLATWTRDLGTPIATGSTTARSLADRFADVVNVLDYGASTTATAAANTTAFEAALAVGSIFIPEGTYLVNEITVSNSGRTIQGESYSTILKRPDNNREPIFKTDGVDDCVFTNFKIDGNKANNLLDDGDYTWDSGASGPLAETAQGDITCVNGSNIVVRNVYFLNSLALPVRFEGMSYSVITECLSEGHQREGFMLSGGNDCSIDGCISRGLSSPLPWSLIGTRGTTGVDSSAIKHNHKVVNNICYDSQAAFLTINTTFTVVKGNIVGKKLGLSSTGPGIRLGHTTTYTYATGCFVEGNYITGITDAPTSDPASSSAGRGISVENGSESKIIENHITDCRDGIGVSVTENQQNGVIKDNLIHEPALRGVYLFKAENFRVTENTVRCDNNSGTTAFDIRANDCFVAFNRVQGATEYGFRTSRIGSLYNNRNYFFSNHVSDAVVNAWDIDGGTDGSNYGVDNVFNNNPNVVDTTLDWTVVSGATPDVENRQRLVLDNLSATNVTGFTNGLEGETYIVFFNNSNSTLVHGSGFILKGNVNVTPSYNKIMQFVYKGTDFYEVSRSF